MYLINFTLPCCLADLMEASCLAERFRKAPCPIGERLAWSLMMPGRSNAHECPHLQALFRDHPPPYWRGYAAAAFRDIKTIAECLADELINAAKEPPNSYALKKKDELERVAKFNGYAVLRRI
ncbi:hypothetical protein PRIPAC_90978 [Pristionchus pacificus]|uniref:Ribosomal protein n=1 Tax=Pristionchus pacificus TaxID=54126 RepID=A0A2A6B6A0_PRIPA|nr:hypothetical protein PRIPAC_90978 [Pristionchus pacificus]|eukprot:PDM61410.1 ribosomal protein [Pristionchus pacificus]